MAWKHQSNQLYYDLRHWAKMGLNQILNLDNRLYIWKVVWIRRASTDEYIFTMDDWNMWTVNIRGCRANGRRKSREVKMRKQDVYNSSCPHNIKALNEHHTRVFTTFSWLCMVAPWEPNNWLHPFTLIILPLTPPLIPSLILYFNIS